MEVKSRIFVEMLKHLFITVLLSLPIVGFSQQYFFNSWDANDGLAVTDINAITQDPLGYIWLATEGGGLVNFDGVNFNSYTVDDNLPSNFVSTFAWDVDSNLWIGTENGVAVHNGQQIIRLDSLYGYSKDRVIGIRNVDSHLYLAFRHKILLFSDSSFIELNSDYFSNQTIYSLSEFEGELLVSCDSGLVKGSLDGLRFPDETKSRSFTFLSEQGHQLTDFDDYGYAWIKTDWGGYSDTIKSDNKLRTAIDWKNFLVYNSQDGILLIAPNGVTSKYDESNGLSVDQVKCLFDDKNGNLWIGGSTGLSKLVNPFIGNFNELNGLKDERVHSILQEGDRVWFGTNSGVEVLDRKSGFNDWYNYTSNRNELEINGLSFIKDIPEILVLKIFIDRSGTIWFGTENGLYSLYNEELKHWSEDEGLLDNFIFDISEHNGILYVATGSNVYFLKDNVFNSLFGQDDQMGARLIKKDQNDEIWFLLLTGELGKYSDNNLNVINSLGDLSLLDFRINTIEFTENNEMLLGTSENGLIFWNSERAEIVAKEGGLFSAQVLDITKSEEDLFWVLSTEGVQGMLVKNGNLILGRYLGEADGFLGNECYANSFFLNNLEQVLWVGTKNGVVSLNIDELKKQKWNYQPSITRVDLFFNENSDWSGFESENWSNVPYSIRLPSDQNYLTFHFTAPSSIDPEQLFYRYRLKGNDDEWIRAENRKFAIYTGIAHGKYSFEVEAALTPAFAIPRKVTLPVIIVPPFYKTFWFWMLVVLVVGGITAWLIRLRINQLNEKINLESALAESERKALRLQMNPHFIFNSLDSISGFIFKNEPKLAVTYLNSFAKLMRLTLESSRKTLVPLHTELNLLKNYLLLEQVRFSNSFEFTINVEEGIDNYTTMLPPMLIQPSIENSVIHGLRPKEGKGVLTIDFNLDDDHLNCTIVDNGVGRERAQEIKEKSGRKHGGVSTDITEERIELLKKSLNRDFDFQVIDLLDGENPLGTKVILTFPLIEDDGFDE